MSVTLHHAPHTRSTGVLCLLEELGAPHALRIVNLRAGEGRRPGYLALNPLGKVPALTDLHGAVVTEQAAIFLYLADAFPDAGLAPAPSDPLRGPYLRWTVFYAAAFEPAVIDRGMGRGPPTPGVSHYGTYEETLSAARGMLAPGPWVLGDRFSAADILWATALDWTMETGTVAREPLFERFVARVVERPAVARARARDAELAASQAGAGPA